MRFHAHLRRAVIYRELRIDHGKHQLQERQSPKNLSSRDYICICVYLLVRDEGYVAGTGHGFLEDIMEDHAMLE